MRTIGDFARAARLMQSAIDDMKLNLNTMNVLTEAASGPFVVTPLIAALAGADKVYAATQNSRFGRADDVAQYTYQCAQKLGIQNQIEVVTNPPVDYADKVNIITNLGFIRPISDTMIAKLPKDAAVSLMWEPWEFREGEVDVTACIKHNIPVLGTNEHNPRLEIFRYLGHMVFKYLYHYEIEVFKSKILLLGSGHFGQNIYDSLIEVGADVKHVDAPHETDFSQVDLDLLDAIVIAEHVHDAELIGGQNGISCEEIKRRGIKLVHISGVVCNDELEASGLSKHPAQKVPARVMTATTDVLGPRPVIDLHAGGLKVGALLVEGLRKGMSIKETKKFAIDAGFGADFPDDEDVTQ